MNKTHVHEQKALRADFSCFKSDLNAFKTNREKKNIFKKIEYHVCTARKLVKSRMMKSSPCRTSSNRGRSVATRPVRSQSQKHQLRIRRPGQERVLEIYGNLQKGDFH